MSDSGKSKLGPGGEAPAPPPPKASRKAPPKVEPVVVDGVRYEQVINAELIGGDQRSGVLAAYDEASGDRLWTIKVYAVGSVAHLEADVQDVFFKRMALRPDGNSIEIENERGNVFVVDLASRSVTPG